MKIAVKICGLSDNRAVEAVIADEADYAGFVYFPASPRHVTFERAAELKKLLPPAIRSVSVMVDPDDALLAQMQSVLKPDYVQLHGKESPQRILDIRKKFPAIKIIKAISVKSGDDVSNASGYEAADMLMFDAKAPGSGKTFDWTLLKGREFPKPWFLSGGLNAENVAEAIRISGAKMVDVSSGVESAPGVKDAALIKAFVKVAKHETTT